MSVIPISDKHIEFSKKVIQRMRYEGFCVSLDESNMTLNKKIRNLGLMHYNYGLVIGDEEMANNMVDVRN